MYTDQSLIIDFLRIAPSLKAGSGEPLNRMAVFDLQTGGWNARWVNISLEDKDLISEWLDNNGIAYDTKLNRIDGVNYYEICTK